VVVVAVAVAVLLQRQEPLFFFLKVSSCFNEQGGVSSCIFIFSGGSCVYTRVDGERGLSRGGEEEEEEEEAVLQVIGYSEWKASRDIQTDCCGLWSDQLRSESIATAVDYWLGANTLEFGSK